MKTTITITEKEIEAVFAEWARRWREEPERFQNETHRLRGSSEGYGEAATEYFIQIWQELPTPPAQVVDGEARHFFGAGGDCIDLGLFAKNFNGLPSGERRRYTRNLSLEKDAA
jgi:hypothetical protein